MSTRNRVVAAIAIVCGWGGLALAIGTHLVIEGLLLTMVAGIAFVIVGLDVRRRTLNKRHDPPPGSAF